jgi:hypothetical protein
MAEDAAQASDPLHDRAQVRIFTLADYIAEEPSGKLYISGAGLEWTGLPAFPDRLPSFYLLIRLAFPMTMVRPSHIVEVRVLHADGSPAAPDPVLFQADMHFDVDTAPDYATEMSDHIPIQVTNYPVTAQPDGVIFLYLLVDDTLISRLPVQLRPINS